jgi:5-hydroxyisourate hydrolase
VTISTHVLDLSAGKPAAAVPVRLDHHDGARWLPIGEGKTNNDGRLLTLVATAVPLPAGKYRLIFDIGAYFAARHLEYFHPRAVIEFIAADETSHYHVPLLVSPYGYSTYRGS